MAVFILIFYVKYWFTTPLSSSAARQDLNFMSGVMEYQKVNSQLSFKVLQSTYRHLWYLTPQLITLSLLDKGLKTKIKEEIATVLHDTERVGIQTGKPTFPMLPYEATKVGEDMSYLVGYESWLIFDLQVSQDWLLHPASDWHFSPELNKLLAFTNNLVVVNDLTERGVHLATDFIKRVESEEQRMVEEFPERDKDVTKSSLKKS